MQDVRDVMDDYRILRLEPVDDEGNRLPKRDTGYNHVPEREHDRLTAMAIAEVWMMTPDACMTDITASEFYRRLALVKARTWDQPTRQQMEANRDKRRMGR